RRGGGLRVALDDAGWAEARDTVAAQRADGVPVELVDAATARRLAPGLSPDCRGGVHCAIDGQAEALATVQAFAEAARRLGVRIEEGVVAGTLAVDGGRVAAIVRGGGSREACDVAVVAGCVVHAPASYCDGGR